MSTQPSSDTNSPRSSTPLLPNQGATYREDLRDTLFSTTLMALSIVPFVLTPYYAWPSTPIRPHGPTVAIGAAGWVTALFLRAPISLLTSKLSPAHTITITIWASGPCEEGIRVALLYLVPGTATFEGAWSLALGWTAIEIWYTLVQAGVWLKLQHDDSEKAREARAKIREIYGDDMFNKRKGGWWWGGVERASASMIHIGFSMWEVVNPFAAIPAAVVHSAINAGAVIGMKKIGITKTEIWLLAAASGIFFGALAAMRRL
ncbi:hypothetical protein BC938DRAFT_471685 [Jimgerdemannia flammicorona]|uniref:Uncharacterized protein n=1 Tax=Jimgerdemannia flammicorona TaxID=994334 RepID=A0A433Q7N4_9FUNG|nr:hypothetical protein BC938DRAFT_471685 [Jimgerdemannia flammicorona]